MTTDRILTVRETVALSTIVEAAIHGRRIRRLMSNGDVLEGVARSIGDERGNHASDRDDVRDCYLRVSAGFEHFWPVAELLTLLALGEFVVD